MLYPAIPEKLTIEPDFLNSVLDMDLKKRLKAYYFYQSRIHSIIIDQNITDIFRRILIATRSQKNALSAFCEECRSLGYPVYEMDLIQEGEEAYAAMKRSTNGGGENSPFLSGEDDYYEMFFADL